MIGSRAATAKNAAHAMAHDIHSAPHGSNLVVETKSGRVIIGRFDSTNGFQVVMHDCDVYDPPAGSSAEDYIRETAKYGVDVKQRDLAFDVSSITRWRKLGDIPKPD